MAMENIAERLPEHARDRPDHPAIVDGELVVTYGELDPLVSRMALGLRAAGVGPSDIVGLCLKDRAAHLILHYAIARLGAAILPLDIRWTEEERGRVARFFEAKLVCVEAGETAGAGETLEVTDDWLDTLPSLAGGETFPADRKLPLALSLSSGTTGRPKGPMINHGHMLARFENQRSNLGFVPEDRYLSTTPLYFGVGRHFTLGILFCGATVIFLPPPYSAADMAEAAVRSNASVSITVPTMLRRLLELPRPDGPVLGGLRVLYSTGAILHTDERAAVLRDVCPNLINYYGSTEGGGLSLLTPDAPPEAQSSVGLPQPGTEAEVVDENDRPLPAGEIGRVRYRGATVADSFHNDAQASAESFRDGWFYPGDLGRIDENGYLYLAGRAKDMIIRAGVNIYPEEVEQVLRSHPSVREAAVVGWASAARGEEVAAFVVTEGAGDDEALKRHCADSLAPYKVPRGIFFVDEMPRNAMGKIRKPDLATGLPALED